MRYLRLPRLNDELAAAQVQGHIGHWLKTLSRIDLLLLDEFGLVPKSPAHQPLLLELLEDHQQRGSVLLTRQLPIKLWHGQFNVQNLADAILVRLIHNAEVVELNGDSMRKKHAKTTPPNDDKSTPNI